MQAGDRVEARDLDRLARASAAAGATAAAARASSCRCPGGPCRKRLCPPAAATSSAGTSALWPRTSERSGSSATGSAAAGSRRHRRRDRARRAGPRPPPASDSTPRTSRSGTSAASARARAAGAPAAPSPARRAASAIASAPRIGAHLAVERQLADDRAAVRAPRAATWPLAASTAIATGRSNAGADLAQVRRREVDRDPLAREHEAGVRDRRADALARLAHRLVGEPDDRERRQPASGCRPPPTPGAPRRRRARRCRRARGPRRSERPSRWSRRDEPRRRASTVTPIASKRTSSKYGRSRPARANQIPAIRRTCERLRSCRLSHGASRPARHVLTSQKTSALAVDGDEVELTQPRPEVARDDAPAEPLDVRGGELLAQPAEGLRAHARRRYGRRRHGSARECHDSCRSCRHVSTGRVERRRRGVTSQRRLAAARVESTSTPQASERALAAASRSAAPRARAAGTPSTGSSSGAAARRPGARSPPGARASSSRRASRTPSPG